jgi:antitoxin component YwqK of YwqJK toxin-antitoxin module
LHGLYERYYSNGKLSWRVNYVNGNKRGLSEWYIYSGDIKLRNLEFFL